MHICSDCEGRPCYIGVMKTNLMHYLSSVYFANQLLHVVVIFVAHRQAGRSTDSQLKSTTPASCCMYTLYFLMMGYKYAQNMYRLIGEIN